LAGRPSGPRERLGSLLPFSRRSSSSFGIASDRWGKAVMS
jgi:hypothetical protein